MLVLALLEARQASDDEIASWAHAEAPWEELAATIRRQQRPRPAA